MATEEQTVANIYSSITNGISWGQRVTITNRVVSKLSFYLSRTGSPDGAVTFLIRAVDGDAILATKLLGNSIDISTTPAWYEVEFDTPVLINEEVYLLQVATGGEAGNLIQIYSSYPNDVKEDEYLVTRGGTGIYTNRPDYDSDYIYTYEALLAPTVTTQAVTAKKGTIATGNGNITDLGGTDVTQHGHCWVDEATYDGGNHPPTTADDKTEKGAAAETGAFTSSMTGLTKGTLYYVKAYATNSIDTSYGALVSFTTSNVYPSDTISRVSSIRHIYRPGFFRMQVGLGDLGFDIDVAESAVRSALDTTKEVVEPPAELPVTKPSATRAPAPPSPPAPAPSTTKPGTPSYMAGTPITPPPTVPAPPPVELTEYAKKILETPAAKALSARVAGLRQGVEAVVTPYAIEVLMQKEQEAKILTELQRVTKAASATGITSYARQVLLKRAVQLKIQLEQMYR